MKFNFKFVIMILLGLFLSLLISLAIIKSVNDSNFKFEDVSLNINCKNIDLSGRTILITNQNQFEELNCETNNNESIDFLHDFILVKPYTFKHSDGSEIEVLVQRVNNNEVVLEIDEPIQEIYPDLMGMHIFYIQVDYRDLNEREIFFE